MSIFDYPAPAYAGYIWTSGDVIWLAIPGERRGHAIHFPNNEAGVRLCLRILRNLEQARTIPKICEPAAPTQWDADQQLRALSVGVKKLPPSGRKPEKVSRINIDEIFDLGDILKEIK